MILGIHSIQELHPVPGLKTGDMKLLIEYHRFGLVYSVDVLMQTQKKVLGVVDKGNLGVAVLQEIYQKLGVDNEQ